MADSHGHQTRDVTVTCVTVNHGKNSEGYRLSFNYHGNRHGGEPLCRKLTRYTCTVCSVRLLCSEEDMAEGGRDSRGPHGICPSSKKPNLQSGCCGCYKNAQDSWWTMAAMSAGAARTKLL